MAALVHRVPGTVAEPDLLPVGIEDAQPVVGLARPHPRVRVLHPAVDPVRVAIVHRDPVELADGEVVEAVVGDAKVPAFVQSAVAAEEQVARIARVDPQRVVVVLEAQVVRGRVRHRLEGGAAVFALGWLHAHQPHALVGGGVDVRFAVVHRPGVVATGLFPSGARVLRAIRAAGALMLDGGDHDVRV